MLPDPGLEKLLEAVLAKSSKAEQQAELATGEAKEPERLSGTQGHSTFSPVSDDEINKARLETVEARTDAKFASLRSDVISVQVELGKQLSEIKADLARKPGTGTLIATAIAIVGVLLAVMAFAGGRFDSGMSARSMVEDVQKHQKITDTRQDAKLDAILDRLPQK